MEICEWKTGSLYLCSTVFLPLALSSTNPFWQGEAAWTAQKEWNGEYTSINHAIN